MAITSLDGWISSAKQQITMFKSGARTTIAAMPFSSFDLAGQPGAGVLAGTNTANGVVPTDSTAGHPLINSFTGGATGYLSNISCSNTVAADMMLFDMLFKAGAYSFDANVTLTSQPTYTDRIPNGDYTNTEIWLEAATGFTGNLTITVTYTNQSGATGRTTGAIATGVAPTLGRMIRLPLQAGDSGVQKIESVVCSGSTVGTFNLLVLRRLFKGRIYNSGGLDAADFGQLGMPIVFDTSAFVMVVAPDSTAHGIPEMNFTIVNG